MCIRDRGEGDCDLSGFANAAGDGAITIAEAVLETDADNIAECDPVGEAHVTTFIMSGVYSADWSGNEVKFSREGGTPSFCTSFPIGAALDDAGDCDGAEDCVVICPICFQDPPADMGVQVTDDDDSESNAICVDTSGV